MKRNFLVFLALTTSFGGLASSPIVSNVTIEPAGDRIFSNSSFAYDLSGAPGIVTFYLETNGVPVDCPYVHVSGDMNRLLQPGRHTFRWRNDLDWPGHAIRTPDCRLVVKAWATNSPPDYLIYNLKTPSEAPRYYAKATDVPDGVTATKYKIDHLVMRRIHAAGQTYLMGTPPNDPAYAAATAPHEVAFTKDFYIGIYELTFGQMLTVKTSSPSVITAYANVHGPGKGSENAEIMAEVNKTTDLHYSRAAAMTQYKYYWFGSGASYVYPNCGRVCSSTLYMQAFRTATQNETMFLPTSYQWEFACRAGCGARLYNGSNSTNATASADVGELGWFNLNNSQDPDWFKVSGKDYYLPHVVGLKTPNAWGLYDMLGNVAEVCADVYVSSPVTNADGTPIVDPSGPDATNSDPSHPLCGGNLYQTATSLCAGKITSHVHGGGALNVGFRLVCDVEVSR